MLVGDVEGQQLFRDFFFLTIQVALVQPIQLVGHVASLFQQIVYPI